MFTSLLPIHKPWMFFVMRGFGFYNYKIMLICAFTGSCLGSYFNYELGKVLHFVTKYQKKINVYMSSILVLLVAAIGWFNILGAFLFFVAGFTETKSLYVTPAIICTHMFYFTVII